MSGQRACSGFPTAFLRTLIVCDFSEKGIWGWLQRQFVRSALGTPVT